MRPDTLLGSAAYFDRADTGVSSATWRSAYPMAEF